MPIPVHHNVKRSPDGNYLFSSGDRETHIYKLTEAGPEFYRTVAGQPATITYDGKYLMLFRAPDQKAAEEKKIYYCESKELVVSRPDGGPTLKDVPCEPNEGLWLAPYKNVIFKKDENGNYEQLYTYCQPIIDFFCLATKTFVTHRESFDRDKLLVLNPNETVFSYELLPNCSDLNDEEREKNVKKHFAALFAKSEPDSYIFNVNNELAFKRHQSIDPGEITSTPSSKPIVQAAHTDAVLKALTEELSELLKQKNLIISVEEGRELVRAGILTKGLTRPFGIAISKNGRYVVIKGHLFNFAVIDLLKLTTEDFCRIYTCRHNVDQVSISPDGSMALVASGICANNDFSRQNNFLPSLNETDEGVKERIKKTKVFLVNLSSGDYFLLREAAPVRYMRFSKEGSIFIWGDQFEVINVARIAWYIHSLKLAWQSEAEDPTKRCVTLAQATHILELYKKTNESLKISLSKEDFGELSKLWGPNWNPHVLGDLEYYFDCGIFSSN